ncbi:MAG: ClpXP protease specificity-enhancing factor [Arenicella sp.]|nr:ClpXP protease specificity-enhancing factor [Arenicella sp.]
MNTISMTSTKPYLLRAIFEWAEDNDFTPQVLVDAEVDGVEVPLNHVVDGQIVLNISSTAVQLHVMDNQCLSFSARFSGVEQDIYLPIESVMAIFARENSQGIFFEEADDDGSDPDDLMLTEVPASDVKKAPRRKKGDASHLKIIK